MELMLACDSIVHDKIRFSFAYWVNDRWGSRATTIFSGEITVDSLHNYYTQIGKNDVSLKWEGYCIDNVNGGCVDR